MLTVGSWEKRLYPDPAQRDPCITFIDRVRGRIASSMHVLDVGAGAGELNAYDFRGRCKELVGVDVDPRVSENPLLDRGIQANADSLPFADESFDLAFSIYVLEHVERPDRFCAEVARVLKPGGEFWALTPNRKHYVPLIARLTPTRFHKWFNETREHNSEDTFPTFYRLNSPFTLRKHFGSVGMDDICMDAVEVRPNYLDFSLPTFLAGAVYERIVNSTELLRAFRVNYICGFRKDAEGTSSSPASMDA